MTLGWFNYRTFDATEFEKREKVENGDFSWIIPGKFIAMSAPHATNYDAVGLRRFTPEDYVPEFNRLGVKVVIRLNNETYAGSRFTSLGIDMHELFFVDGTCPSEDIVNRFLDISESTDGAIAVHCKAGLGRTGTLIGVYAMKHHKFPAREFIAWNRI
jgi:cell division cycle 14